MTQDEYIVANRQRRVEDLALELSRRKDLDASFVLRQIEGWQRMRVKVPRWTEVDDIHFPPRLALEQCSGQPAAEYKARVASSLSGEHGSFCDLTGGMGIDFSFIAPLYNTCTYVEQRAELVEAARHNFPLLRLPETHIVHGDGIAHLKTMQSVDLLFLDPARRDANGGKTVLIEDCEPDVKALLPLLRSKCRWLMVKLSTMLDIRRTIATLPAIREVHVFSSGGECKDLLLVIEGEAGKADNAYESAPSESAAEKTTEPTIFCSDEHSTLTFTPSQEAATSCATAESLEGYLFEPGPSIMKAGAYRTVAAHYGIAPLQSNSHLYVAPHPVDHFQGRTFRIVATYTFSKQDLKALAESLKAEGGKANLTVRNFPATVADLRKRLKIKEGGSTYLFATTDAQDRKIIIACKKI